MAIMAHYAHNKNLKIQKAKIDRIPERGRQIYSYRVRDFNLLFNSSTRQTNKEAKQGCAGHMEHDYPGRSCAPTWGWRKISNTDIYVGSEMS